MVEHPFTVGELKRALEKVPDDFPVVLSSDEEGNNIRMVNGVYLAHVESLEHNYIQEIHPDDTHEYDEYYTVLEVW